jgi:hypothetical protein
MSTEIPCLASTGASLDRLATYILYLERIRTKIIAVVEVLDVQ